MNNPAPSPLVNNLSRSAARARGRWGGPKRRSSAAARLPVNTDGGGLAARQPGMRGLFLLVEAVRRLRGEAGERQVRARDGALPRLGVASGTSGWFCSSGTVVLGREWARGCERVHRCRRDWARHRR
ncbi:hypothetical protein SUDANB178_04170 [Streptomyces sp. enrichment culture]